MNAKARGFTLIELLVIISIIGFLAAVILVTLDSARKKSRDARRLSDIHQIQSALELFYTSCSGYPSAFAINNAQGCPSGTTFGSFMLILPTNPTPGGVTYTYASASPYTTYTLIFSLEGQTSSLSSGSHTASPTNIQ